MLDFNAANKTATIPAANKDYQRILVSESTAMLDPLDPAPAIAKLQEYENEIQKMTDIAQAVSIVDQASNLEAVAMASQAVKLFKAIEHARKELVKEPNEFVKGVNSFAKVYTAKLKAIENELKTKLNSYAYKLEIARREAEQKAQEEARKLQAAVDREAKKKNIKPVVLPPPVMPVKTEPTRTAEGSASTRKVWTWEVEDHSIIPYEWMVLDEKRVNQAVRLGTRNIAGIRIFQETKTVLRT